MEYIFVGGAWREREGLGFLAVTPPPATPTHRDARCFCSPSTAATLVRRRFCSRPDGSSPLSRRSYGTHSRHHLLTPPPPTGLLGSGGPVQHPDDTCVGLAAARRSLPSQRCHHRPFCSSWRSHFLQKN
ncbi:Importin N-terminal domain-containing protein [Psidium guajava]|nr:Importin N-terminal domain-containing protein [Psidium guajava]